MTSNNKRGLRFTARIQASLEFNLLFFRAAEMTRDVVQGPKKEHSIKQE